MTVMEPLISLYSFVWVKTKSFGYNRGLQSTLYSHHTRLSLPSSRGQEYKYLTKNDYATWMERELLFILFCFRCLYWLVRPVWRLPKIVFPCDNIAKAIFAQL